MQGNSHSLVKSSLQRQGEANPVIKSSFCVQGEFLCTGLMNMHWAVVASHTCAT